MERMEERNLINGRRVGKVGRKKKGTKNKIQINKKIKSDPKSTTFRKNNNKEK
jgi:hypothetical protein